MDSLTLLLLPHLATVLGFLLAAILIGRALRQHDRPVTSLAWVMAIVLIPHVGVPAYLLFGGRKLRSLASRKRPLYEAPPVPAEGPDADTGTEALLCSHGMPHARPGNRVRLITASDRAYTRLVELIEGAQRSIHVTTFIFGHDRIGQDLAARLARRAGEGIEVRLLVDALGSLKARLWLLRRLRRSGVQVGIFMRMLPLHRKWSANLRNHRKIALFDDALAITGGMNLAGDYLGPEPDPRRWIDTMLEIEGPLVADLHVVFARDWEFATGEQLATPAPAPAIDGGDLAQVVPSGPDVDGDPLYDAVVAAIYRARRRVWIATPYFLPDVGLLRALQLQARMGIDVRLVLPLQSNHWSADMVRNRVLRTVAGSGIRAYLHPGRMIHAKHLVVDDAVGICGSANMDPRSMYLNYEVAVFCYSGAGVTAISAWMEQFMTGTREARLPQPTLLRQFTEDLCWLASPLL